MSLLCDITHHRHDKTILMAVRLKSSQLQLLVNRNLLQQNCPAPHV